MKRAVLEFIVKENMWWESQGVTSISFVCSRFDITKYKARKIIKELIADGLIELAFAPGGWSEDGDGPYPPRKGYKTCLITKQSEMYKRLRKEQHEEFAKMCE